MIIGDIAVKRRNATDTVDIDLAATTQAFKNCAPFKDCRTEISDTFVDYSVFINIVMPMLNTVRIILILSEVYDVLKEMR